MFEYESTPRDNDADWLTLSKNALVARMHLSGAASCVSGAVVVFPGGLTWVADYDYGGFVNPAVGFVIPASLPNGGIFALSYSCIWQAIAVASAERFAALRLNGATLSAPSRTAYYLRARSPYANNLDTAGRFSC